MNNVNTLPPVYIHPADVQVVQQKPQKASSVPIGVAGAITGGIVAGTASAFLANPYFDGKEVTNSFAESSYKNLLKKSSTHKDTFKQIKKFLEDLKKVKTPDELKTLFNNNKFAAESFESTLDISLDGYLKTITSDNLAGNRKVISETITQQKKNKLQLIKNWIKSCWDSSKKEFKKADGVPDDVFNSIKDARNGCKVKMIAKYAGIAAALSGIVCYATHRLVSDKKQAKQTGFIK